MMKWDELMKSSDKSRKSYASSRLQVTIGLFIVTMSSILTSISITSTIKPFLSAYNKAHTAVQVETSHKIPKILDFFIVGFPKCGTTTLKYTFQTLDETAIPHKEYCQINSKVDYLSLNFTTLLNEVSTSPSVQRGIKCPNSVRNFLGLYRLTHLSPHTKLLIGVRHPVFFFQSFYNYRITEIHNKNWSLTNIPDPLELMRGGTWKQVSTELARFELSLMQLAKTALSSTQLQMLGNNNYMVVPNKFKIFLYATEQLDDKNETRSALFREDMRQFLSLQTPIPPFSHENNNGNVNYPEHFSICDGKYKNLREMLTRQGESTAKWIRNVFLKSEDVFVGGKEYFEETLGGWARDPCLNTN